MMYLLIFNGIMIMIMLCEHQLKTVYLLILNGIMRLGDLFPTCSSTRDLYVFQAVDLGKK